MKVEEITVQEKVNRLLHDVKEQLPLLPPTWPIFLKFWDHHLTQFTHIFLHFFTKWSKAQERQKSRMLLSWPFV